MNSRRRRLKKIRQKKRALDDAQNETPKKKIQTEELSRDDRTVFVGGLSWDDEESTLNKYFSECGEIEELRPLKDDHGNFKGVCFITFVGKDGVDAALKKNDQEYNGRWLRVNMAQSGGKSGGKDKGGKKGDKGKGKGKGPMPRPEGGCLSIIVRGLGNDTWEDALQKHFGECGGISRTKVCYDDDHNSKGFGFVDFETAEAADAAIKKHESTLDGATIRVDYSPPKEKGDGKGKDGKGKGKGKDGKKGKGKGKKKGDLSAEKLGAKHGSIQEFAGEKKTFGGDDSDSD